MSKISQRSKLALGVLAAAMAVPAVSQAAFVEGSKASLELRNFYFNRDFRNSTDPVQTQAKAEEWAQGFVVRAESGYTDGTIGFGVDALADLGVKLDSGRGTSGTGLLLRDSTKQAQDTYSDLGLTAKLKASNTVLKYGTLVPKLPTVSASESRLVPQTFEGAYLNSKEISGLTLDAARLTRINQRDSQDFDPINATIKGGTVGGEADSLTVAGITYKWNDQLTTSYNYGDLDKNYKQNIFNVVHVLPIAQGQSLKTDLRYAKSTDNGFGNIVDNKATGVLMTYTLNAHKLGLGYQTMSGDTGYAYVGGGADPFLVNYVQISDFANRDEKSWQGRYDFDFASVGVPGLTFMTRYIYGYNVFQAVGPAGREWERDTELKYVFQSGSLKNLGIHWRNAMVRSNFANDLDENRLIVSYTLPLL